MKRWDPDEHWDRLKLNLDCQFYSKKIMTIFVLRTVKDNEKTVGVAVSASCAALYDQFPHFKTDAKTFQTGMSFFLNLSIFVRKFRKRSYKRNINKRASVLATVIFSLSNGILQSTLRHCKSHCVLKVTRILNTI